MFLSSYLLFPHLIILVELGELTSIFTPNLFHALDILFSSKTRTGYCLWLSPVIFNVIFLVILKSNIRNYRINVKGIFVTGLDQYIFYMVFRAYLGAFCGVQSFFWFFLGRY